MTYQTIITDLVDESICLITLNRPQAANALNQHMAEELADALAQAAQTPAIRAIILTGSGKRAFCAGADLKERHGMDKAAWKIQHAAFEKALHAVMHCPKPVIAAVNGAAMGGGMELALACDMIYASKTARFGLTEATLGIIPGMGGTQILARAIGKQRAKEILFLGKVIGADEGHGLGFVNHTCQPESLMETVVAAAFMISSNAPQSLAAIKRSVDEGMDQPLAEALHTELRYYETLLETHDRHEGINAFNEKRKPRFTGE